MCSQVSYCLISVWDPLYSLVFFLSTNELATLTLPDLKGDGMPLGNSAFLSVLSIYASINLYT